MKVLLFCLLFILSSLFANESKNFDKNKNIWIKTYLNYKNYNSMTMNIIKLEQELQKNRNNLTKIQELNKKLTIYKSKISLYEKNNNFDNLLKTYKYEIGKITIYDFLFSVSLDTLNKKIIKYKTLKKDFYLALVNLQEEYEELIKEDKDIKRINFIKEEIEFFNEYSENVEKMFDVLLESKEELKNKYIEYKNEVFIKHIITVFIILISYIFYKIILTIIFKILRKKEDSNFEHNYRKLFSLFFVLSILIFIVIRYIDDFIYILTFLGVIAAALTIATREIILNIAGAIYLFFTNIVRVGDRVMVQFETKHTIGDIVNISLIKMKLNEIEDYSSVKELKSVGRTIYIPNSYIFTKVFYNYSLKKSGFINDLIEFEFDSSSDFKELENISKKVFDNYKISYNMNFSLNNTKTGILALISYQSNYKTISEIRGKISIDLLKAYEESPFVKLKQSKVTSKKDEDS